MKTVIAALNSKYIHFSPAPWFLKSYCGDAHGEIVIKEFNINDSLDAVLSSIYAEKADIAAFSCYIWNIGHVLKLCENLKKVHPEIITILGGPEVSYDPVDIMRDNPSVDYIISGEGERPFKGLLEYLSCTFRGLRAAKPGSLTYRCGEDIKTTEPSKPVENLDEIPSPYTADMLSQLNGRMLYYESSRGCPYSCSYCMSSISKGIRFFSLERVKREIDTFFKAGVKQVKFTDRTFNCNRSRAKEIFAHIIRLYGEYKSVQGTGFNDDINFHFEVVADLFDDEMIEMLTKAPTGLIQFEIGLQSFNEKTLEAIDRPCDIDATYRNIARLKEKDNMHIHLDLIAGLPFEDFTSFGRSFDLVYSLRPHMLQLGFLKLLKGTKIRREAGRHGYMYKSYSPYEVLRNSYLSYDELVVLKGIEELVERYYNSGRFVRTLSLLTGKYFQSPFAFFNEFYRYCLSRGCLDSPVAARDLYGILLDFLQVAVGLDRDEREYLTEVMKLDFLASDRSANLPPVLERISADNFKESCYAFLKDEDNIKKYLPGYAGLPLKLVIKNVHFEIFRFNMQGAIDMEPALSVALFDYGKRNPVTGLYRFVFLSNFKF